VHNQLDGAPLTFNSLPALEGNAYQLLASSSSDVCLNCHQAATPGSYEVVTSSTVLAPGTPPLMMTPGGDFAWLLKSYTWNDGAVLMSEDGDRHGHNIVAPDANYQQDGLNTQAPGGTFPSSALQCTSCHDPHGKYRIDINGLVSVSGAPILGSGSESNNGVPVHNPTSNQAVGTYRMLAGVGYTPLDSGVTFTEGPPAAMAPVDYNRSEAVTQTRVAYGDGMSSWCTNCHGDFHQSQSESFRHSSQRGLGGTIRDFYNTYVKTNDFSGTDETAFLSLVPFARVLGNSVDDRNTLASMARSDDANLWGPNANDRVSCLTCHRAHASGWRNLLRWNPDTEFLTTSDGQYPGLDNGAPSTQHMGRTEAETRRAYYDRPADVFAPNQNSLCEKCHQTGLP